jgi:hypothetical protein
MVASGLKQVSHCRRSTRNGSLLLFDDEYEHRVLIMSPRGKTKTRRTPLILSSLASVPSS